MNVPFQSSHGDFTLLSLIKGLRLQPLKDLRTGDTFAWEVLSWLDNQDAETWFSSLSAESHMAIFCWQATEVLKSNGNYWLNLPVKVLTNPLFIDVISFLRHQNRLTLEIQDPNNIMSLDPLEKLKFQRGVRKLRKSGWHVWLDDVASDIAQELSVINVAVDGIKIDRNELVSSYGFTCLVYEAKKLTKFILAEGIENEKQLVAVTKEGVIYGQGFLWPEKKIAICLPDSCINHAKHWFDIKEQLKQNQVSIYINTSNAYIRQGIEYLLWDFIKTSLYKDNAPLIVLCDQPTQADIIVNEHIPGDLPFECISTKAGVILRKQYVISLYKDAEHKAKMRCPGIGSSLCYDDKVSTYWSSLKHSIERILKTEWYEHAVSSSICRLCRKRQLTIREKEIIYMMAKGQTIQSIAVQYGCSRKVIGAHKRALMRKLHIINNMDFYRFLKRIANGVTSV
ncbi:EAL domain-containing protein [Klebsiella pneumoniae]|uniref:EAL domain-containing protein n=1 Tax=Klebsiella pneumoniae TaxID=573 RepID=UPI0039B58F13